MEGAEVKLKSFWEKPEGKTGMIVAAALIGGGIIGFSKILPWLIALASNTLTLIFLLGAIGAVLFLITNPQVRAIFSISFKLAMRKATSLLIKIDPLEILKMKIREMEDNLEKVGTCLGSLKESLARLGRKIAQNDSVLKDSMAKASYAKKTGASDQIFLNTRKAGRMDKSNMTLKELYTKIETMHRVLTKIFNNSRVIIEDTKDEVSVTEEEYKAVRAAHSAMQSAMSIINGDKDKRAIYEEAYEQLSDDIANKSGELQHMLEMSDSLMKNIDLEQGSMQEQGLKMLEEWEKNADSWLNNTASKSDAVSKVNGTQARAPLSAAVEEVVENTNSNFGNLFNK